MPDADPEQRTAGEDPAKGPAPLPPRPPPVVVGARWGGLGLAKGLGLAALGTATLLTVLRVVTIQGSEPIPLTSTPEGPLPGDPVAAEPPSPVDPASPLGFTLTPPPARTSRPGHVEGGAPGASANRNPSGVAEVRLLTA